MRLRQKRRTASWAVSRTSGMSSHSFPIARHSHFSSSGGAPALVSAAAAGRCAIATPSRFADAHSVCAEQRSHEISYHRASTAWSGAFDTCSVASPHSFLFGDGQRAIAAHGTAPHLAARVAIADDGKHKGRLRAAVCGDVGGVAIQVVDEVQVPLVFHQIHLRRRTGPPPTRMSPLPTMFRHISSLLIIPPH